VNPLKIIKKALKGTPVGASSSAREKQNAIIKKLRKKK
jgi:hypothetical protein